MAETRARFLKWEKCMVLVLVICIKCDNASSQTNEINVDYFDFEHIKNEFFTQSDFNESNFERGFDAEKAIKHLKCLKQLAEIQGGLLKNDPWAMKILDSWGKIPSGIFNGNLFEFGEFSECLNIERNGKQFKTQYCLGQLFFDAPSKTSKMSSFNSHDKMRNFYIPGVGLMEEKRKIEQRMMLRPDPKKLSLSFGLCVPDMCSLHLLEPIINDKILKNGSKVSVKFSQATCQFEESPSNLTIIDNYTIVLLALILFLVVASTCYDVICTITSNRPKSQALLTFSFYSNGLKLLSYKKTKSPDMMHCLHGIRVISTQWVVLGHTFIMYVLLPIRNKLAIATFIQQYHNMVILSAVIAVDTFFFMSGLLVSINMLKHLEKTKGKINIPLLYFHRYLRLTPLLGVSFLFTMSLLKFFGSGPLWPMLIDISSSQCSIYWWSTLLYVQNYVNPNKICFAHSWYLSVDMQLFVISPAIVYLIYKLKIKAMPILSLLVLGCIGCTIEVHRRLNLKSGLTIQDKLYFPTHIRFSPWLIGVMFGYMLLETRKRPIRIPQLFNLFAWIVSLALMAAVIFVNYPLQQLDSEATPLEYGLYDALSRVVWSIALCYVVFACVNNCGGPINWFLGHPLWQPLSRLCYSIYIVHFPVIMVMMASIKTSPYFSELTAFHAFIGNFVISVFVAIIATLTFESPIVIIEKLIFGPAKPPQDNRNNTNLEPSAPQNNLEERK
ncbi:nose resistant to fluoxetine protein 6-like [Contarinia nasturtii]|uniref:nose resistant to fluoxetine protein 6-like n=1 Tax=Contarinia nasturtii TaxID=265458 RepID=UPI0012D3BE4B|nr:nose resistant to fluoxetine protein 6-like [Contarinia nasturtii]